MLLYLHLVLQMNPAIKSLFPIFSHHPELVYLDNAATSQKPLSVIQAMNNFYETENANVHRGLYSLSATATRRYEEVRKKAAGLIGASSPETIAFTKGTTESINIVAFGFLKKKLRSGDNVVITAMEHHANLIPWQQVCKQTGAMLNIIPVNAEGDLELSNITQLITPRTRMLAITHICNVLGTINPIDEIISAAHKQNIPVLIDAAQSAGHYPLNVNQLDADFLVFSAHKMFGPFGMGILYSKKEFQHEIEPLTFGGGSIKNVEFGETEFLPYPYNLEAGTPNLSGVIGLGAAIDFLQTVEMDKVLIHTNTMASYFKEKLKSINGISPVGNPKQSAGIVSFVSDNIHPHDVASYLGNSHIAIRAGHHCAQPLLESMGIQSTARVSFAMYNTMEDVDKTINALIDLKKFWS